MLRRKKSNFKRTIKQPIELHTESVHIVTKIIRGEILLEMRFWCRNLVTNQYEALQKQSFDINTQRIITTQLENKRNIDFPLKSISEDKKVLDLIRKEGFYFKKPSRKWTLHNQKEATLLTPKIFPVTNQDDTKQIVIICCEF